MSASASTGWTTSIEAPGAPSGGPLALRQLARPGVPRPRRPRGGDDRAGEGPRLAVRIMDNPVNTYEQVMDVCAAVLGVSLEDGFEIAYTVDHEGSCVVGAWPRAQAERIAEGIRTIGIEVRLEPAAD